MKPQVMNYMQGISSSETSSDEEETEHDQDQEQEQYGDGDDDDDDEDSAKRSYECTFCRRGFTNAQALGGHMNIHRKDKAKAKKLLETPNKHTHDEESMASPFIPQISNQTPNCYTTIFQPSAAANNYYPIINPPTAAYAFQYEFLSTARCQQSLGTNQDLLGPNLSLQIGQSHHVVNTDQVTRGIHQRDGDVVDLELRLGHDPCSNY